MQKQQKNLSLLESEQWLVSQFHHDPAASPVVVVPELEEQFDLALEAGHFSVEASLYIQK